MGGKLIILGCGGSAGVPTIGNWWGNCDPAEPKNTRTRPSIALKSNSTLIIVDTGPDFRTQMNRENLGCPDAIMFTHNHADHVNGIDEMRVYQKRYKRKFPVYAMEETFESFGSNMNHMFESSHDGFYTAVLDRAPLKMLEEITIGDISILPFEQEHGTIHSLGIRVGDIAYSTDMLRLNDHAMDALSGIHTWIVDAASYNGTAYVHANIAGIINMNERIGAKRVFLTHLSPMMDYATLINELPQGYEPAYDGMDLEF